MAVDPNRPLPLPRQDAERVLGYSEEALRMAVAIVSPDKPYADPLDVFPEPDKLRAQDGGLNLGEDQERELRALGAELGFDRQDDHTLSELGLKGAHVIIKGGWLDELLAEIEMVDEDPESVPRDRPGTIFVMADPRREITDPAEAALADRLYDSVVSGGTVKNEYDMAATVLRSMDLVTSAEVPEHDVDGGYDVDNGSGFSNGETTGQFRFMGFLGETVVVLMIASRGHSYTDESGQDHHPRQSDAADMIGVVSDFEKARGDTERPIVFVTGAIDEPSSMVDAARAALVNDRTVGVASYGTKRLADIHEEQQPISEPISQLSDKLRKLALQSAHLRHLLDETPRDS